MKYLAFCSDLVGVLAIMPSIAIADSYGEYQFCNKLEGWREGPEKSILYHPVYGAQILATAQTAASAIWNCAYRKVEVDKTCFKNVSSIVGDTTQTIAFDIKYRGKVEAKCSYRKSKVAFEGTTTGEATCPLCSATQYMYPPCSPFSNPLYPPTCRECSTACPVDRYIKRACNANSNIDCERCKPLYKLGCTATQFSIPCDGTTTTDRTCQNCSTACPADFYISGLCTQTADLQCSPCTSEADRGCNPDTEVYVPCTANSDSTCAPIV